MDGSAFDDDSVAALGSDMSGVMALALVLLSPSPPSPSPRQQPSPFEVDDDDDDDEEPPGAAQQSHVSPTLQATACSDARISKPIVGLVS